MDGGDLYDEFGNYIGPELESDESEAEEEEEDEGEVSCAEGCWCAFNRNFPAVGTLLLFTTRIKC